MKRLRITSTVIGSMPVNGSAITLRLFDDKVAVLIHYTRVPGIDQRGCGFFFHNCRPGEAITSQQVLAAVNRGGKVALEFSEIHISLAKHRLRWRHMLACGNGFDFGFRDLSV